MDNNSFEQWMRTWRRWGIYFSIALYSVFLPLMLLGAVIFAEGRMIAIPAALLMGFLLQRDIRRLRANP